MPVRKLSRNGGGEAGGSDDWLNGGAEQQSQPAEDGDQKSRDKLIDQMISVLVQAKQETALESQPNTGKGKGKSQGDSALDALMGQNTPSRQRLEKAAGEIMAALHAAKQELAQEMETNLKQLKAVLQETQKIAKNMEAVLQEAKAEPKPEEMAKGTSEGKNGVSPEWNPPGMKPEGKADDQKGQDDQKQQAGGKQQSKQEGDEEEPPPWQPPGNGGGGGGSKQQQAQQQ